MSEFKCSHMLAASLVMSREVDAELNNKLRLIARCLSYSFSGIHKAIRLYMSVAVFFEGEKID